MRCMHDGNIGNSRNNEKHVRGLSIIREENSTFGKSFPGMN